MPIGKSNGNDCNREIGEDDTQPEMSLQDRCILSTYAIWLHKNRT